jgi:hypothetical protein
MKAWVVAVGSSLLAASALAQNLQIVAPAAGDVWTFGETRQIKWQFKYLGTSAWVTGRITLERSGGKTVAVIADKTTLASTMFVMGHVPAVGAYVDSSVSWKVVRSANPIFGPAHDYRVRLRPDPPNASYPEVVSAPFSIIVQTVTDQPGGQIIIKKGDCILSSFTAVAVPHDPTHVMIRVEVQNLRYSSSAGLQLHLIKNHTEFKFIRIPQMNSRTRWHTSLKDDAPAPFQTSHYIAILSTGDPGTQPDSVLDRKEASYRRAGTLIGH